jgi:hypothetical protein
MTEQAVSPLHRRMIEDMTIRKFAQKTQHDMCNGSRTSQTTSSAPPIQPNPTTYGAFCHAHHGSGVSSLQR